MKIDLAVLEVALVRILVHAREARGSVIEIPDDLYWFIQKDGLTDPSTPPSDLTLGSLEEDWEQLQRVGRAEREAVGYDLIWASALLRCLGERIP